MPNEFINKEAKKHDIPTEKEHRMYKEAEKISAKEGKKDNYGYITNIFKNMQGSSNKCSMPNLVKSINKKMGKK